MKPVINPHDSLPSAQPRSEVTSRPPALPPETANASFVLKSLDVRGATAFSPDELAEYYRPYLGKTITVKKLFEIMAAMQQLYLDSGYTISKISMPEQPVGGGHIVFQVLEGYVGAVEMDPSLRSAPLLNSFKEAVLAMKPLNTKKLERLMLILNDRPGLNVSSVLSGMSGADASAAGAVKLILYKNDALRSSADYIEADNAGSNYTGPGELRGGVDMNNMGMNYADLFAGATVTTQVKELKQGNAEYTIPVFGISGTTLQFSGGVSRVEPGDNLKDLDVVGKSVNAGIGLRYPLIRQREQTLILGSSFSYNNVSTDILSETLFKDRIRTVDIQVDYSFIDHWSGQNFSTVSATRGLDILGARKTGSDNLSRQDGHSDFTKIEASYTRVQPLTGSFDLMGSVAGQYAFDPLLSSEEFGFGGSGMGRGYDSSEITGDRGISASFELRYNTAAPRWNLGIQPYVFYDIGKVWNIDSSDGNKISAASTGFGVRLNSGAGWGIDTSLAVPLTKPADNPPNYSSSDGYRWLFRVRKSF